jgi:hypothetical protein
MDNQVMARRRNSMGSRAMGFRVRASSMVRRSSRGGSSITRPRTTIGSGMAGVCTLSRQAGRRDIGVLS